MNAAKRGPRAESVKRDPIWACRHKGPPGQGGPLCLCVPRRAGGGELLELPYFGGAGANPSRLRPGSGFGLGFGAFFGSFLPLSLLPMGVSVTQKGRWRKAKKPNAHGFTRSRGGLIPWRQVRSPRRTIAGQRRGKIGFRLWTEAVSRRKACGCSNAST